MTRSSRMMVIALVALLALALVACLGVSAYLPTYDQRTRARILEQVASEIPPGSDAEVMEAFLRKYAESYSVDDRFDHIYAGRFPQSRLDRILGNRKVIVRLQFDADKKFRATEILITYQTL